MFSLFAGIVVAVLCFILASYISGLNKEEYEGKNMKLKLFAMSAKGFSVFAFIAGIIFSSVYFVNSKNIGIVNKTWGGTTLTNGRILATNGENGIQAAVLRDGLHLGKFRWQLKLSQVPLIRINPNSIGIIETRDGASMPSGRVFAPEWADGETASMLNAEYFLSGAKPRGFKGPQMTVLGPGEYPIHPELYDIQQVPMTIVNEGEVGVIKANVAGIPSTLTSVFANLLTDINPEGTVGPGKIGVWSIPLPPGKYWIHPNAYKVTIVDVRKHQIDFIGENANSPEAETSAIKVKARDGIEFFIDNTVIYHIEPHNAPAVVAQVGDPEKVKDIVIAQTRQTVRDKVGEVATLSFINDRVSQQKIVSDAIEIALAPYFVTLDDDSTRDMYGSQLGALLKTQSDREIAKQQEETLGQQQKAALKQQELNKAQQAAEEEKTLATSAYDAKREEQKKLQVITKAQAEAEQVRIGAQAEADKITIQAKANADAIALKGNAEAERYAKIVNALGASNATSIEVVDRIKDQIGLINLPEMLIFGGNGAGSGIDARVLQLLSNDNKTDSTLRLAPETK